jgi:hypothetical protein
MMTELATLKSWMEGLGLAVKVDDTSRELKADAPWSGNHEFVVRPADAASWTISHDRHISPTELEAQWRVPDSSVAPTETVSQAVTQLVCGFPLVGAVVVPAGKGVAVTLSSVVYDEGLTRQAFVLTMSALTKAAEAFRIATQARGQQMAALRDLITAVEARVGDSGPDGEHDDEVGSDVREPGEAGPPKVDRPARTAAARPSGVAASMSPTSSKPAPGPNAVAAASGPPANTPPLSGSEFWFYVDTEQRLMSDGQGSQLVGQLRPGNWYRALHTEAGWVRAIDERGTEGWVQADATKRE